jgi:sugar phosphate isomerase/epimerase
MKVMAQPKVSLSMLHCLGESFGEMVKRLPSVGTRYIEIVDDGWHALNKKRVAMLKEAAQQNNLEYTVHAPFADLNIASPSKPVLEATLKRLTQSINCAAALDAKIWVLHPGMKTGISNFYPDAEWKQNLSSIKQLLKTAQDKGLTAAIENLPGKYWFIMSTPEEFLRFYNETGLEVGIVFDIAHAYLERQVESFLQKLPKKIVHVHVSDNLGETDNHFGVGYGSINFPQFAQTLKQIGYSGKVVIESGDNIPESIQKLNQLFV